MSPEIDVSPLPTPEAGATVVVIDTLRMTTTAAVLLANGATSIRVIAEMDAARRTAAETGALLLGERGERPLDGFDGGNSPLEYLGRNLNGRHVVLTTSNGARAVEAAAGATHLLLGAVVNAHAVARAVLAGAPERVVLSCSGTAGHISMDDLLGAACIAYELLLLEPGARLSDMARTALALLSAYPDTYSALRDSGHGRRLEQRGFGADVEFAAQRNTLDWVAERNGRHFVGRRVPAAASLPAAD